MLLLPLLVLLFLTIGGGPVVSKFVFLLPIIAVAVVAYSQSGQTFRTVNDLTNSKGPHS